MPTTTGAMMLYSALASAGMQHQPSQGQTAAAEQAEDRQRAEREKTAAEAADKEKRANAQGEGLTLGGEEGIVRAGESQTGSTILTQGQSAKKTNKRKYGQSGTMVS